MKYGLLLYNETQNLGDDIQSYAAYKFLPKVDYIIDREKLNKFVPNKNELVSTIMNGWYNHNKYSLPHSPFINPLYISCHFTNNLEKNKPLYLSEYFFDNIKKYEPIGLRDGLVKKYFDENNVQNYFSGCLTLTIEKMKNVKQTNNICLIDVEDDVKKHIMNKFDNNIIEFTHSLHRESHANISWEEKIKNVEDRLKNYQSSKVVITTRLHAALPCLAIGVPVILLYDNKVDDIKNRLGEFTKYLNYYSKEEFLKLQNIFIKNKDNHLDVRNDLIKKVKKFIKDSNSNSNKSDDNIKLYEKYFVNPSNNFENIALKKEEKNINRILECEYEYSKIKLIKEINDAEREVLINQIKDLQKKLNESEHHLYLILNSKGYKILEKLRKMMRVFKK